MEEAIIRSHGRTGYNKGCRCDVCRAAMARDARKSYAARKDRPVPEQVEHGKSCYANWGCRCEVCTAAATEANRPAARRYASTHREEVNVRRRARNAWSTKAATRRGQSWTALELEMAMRSDLTTVQVAQLTGRTPNAVAIVRRRFRGQVQGEAFEKPDRPNRAVYDAGLNATRRERWAALRAAGYSSAEAQRIYTSAVATVEALAARADGKP